MFGTETTTLLAKGNMLNPLRGKMFKRRSRASFECLVNIPGAPLASLSSGVNGGVTRPQEDSDLVGMYLDGTMIGIGALEIWLLIGLVDFSGGEGENDESGDWEIIGARPPVTQSDDPLSGGHLALGMSKTPLWVNKSSCGIGDDEETYSGSAGERSRIIVHVVGALHVADGKHARSVVGSESPIPNGVTAVAERRNVRGEIWSINVYERGAKTKLLLRTIRHRLRHVLPT